MTAVIRVSMSVAELAAVVGVAAAVGLAVGLVLGFRHHTDDDGNGDDE